MARRSKTHAGTGFVRRRCFGTSPAAFEALDGRPKSRCRPTRPFGVGTFGDMSMRNALTALISAASLCALHQPIGSGRRLSLPIHRTAPTVANDVARRSMAIGTPRRTRRGGKLRTLSRVTGSAASGQMGSAAGYGYGYGGPIGAIVGAPFAVVAMPFNAFGMTGAPVMSNTVAPATGTPPYSYESHVAPQPAVLGHCDLIAGNRVCSMP